VLCQAGVWLKNRDPDTADIFYKALVRRCRKTALGREADLRRWFPDLDENGPALHPTRFPENAPLLSPPVQKLAVAPEPAAELTDTRTGYDFRIEPGDTLFAIANAFRERGVRVTVEEVLAANPGLEPTRLQTGQRIFVPVAASPLMPDVPE
jgi:hypothetical protein